MSLPIAADASFDYEQFRSLAQSIIRYETQSTLTATALVHELYLKHRKSKLSNGQNPNSLSPQFAARMMKQILIDRARSRISRKKLESDRGDKVDRTGNTDAVNAERIADLDELIVLLSKELPVNAELARLHLYSEYSIDECADILEISRATAYRKWQFSKAWLQSHMS